MGRSSRLRHLVSYLKFILQEEICTGMTLLMVEQMANLALEIAEYGYIMWPGCIAMEGFAKEVAEHGTLKKTYLGG